MKMDEIVNYVETGENGGYTFPNLTSDDHEKIILEHAIRLRGSMKQRSIAHFGSFIAEMREYLTFGTFSGDEDLKEFQQQHVEKEKWNA